MRIRNRVVGRDLAQLVRADAEQVHGLVHARVHLVRGVDGEARAVRAGEAVLAHVARRHRAARGGERGEVRHGAARDEDALGLRRVAEHRGDPAHDAVLDVDRGVVSAPAVGVHPRGEEVRDDADRVGGRVDEAVEAGVRVAHRVGQDVLAREGENLLEGLALFGHGLVEERRARRPTLPKTGRASSPSRCAATASAASAPRRRSSSGGRSKVGLSPLNRTLIAEALPSPLRLGQDHAAAVARARRCPSAASSGRRPSRGR